MSVDPRNWSPVGVLIVGSLGVLVALACGTEPTLVDWWRKRRR